LRPAYYTYVKVLRTVSILADVSRSQRMPAPTSNDEFLDLVRKSGVLDEKRLAAHVQKLQEAGDLPPNPAKLAIELVQAALLTNYQAEQLVQGRWRRFTVGKYRVLERLGSGGMGSVFLCEHVLMRRRVAVKVLPTAKAADPSSLERFYREARAVAAVDHPNIVHAYDIDKDESLHFIVMEYVEGPSLQEMVRRSGPIGFERACNYISQAAQGLDHACRAGLVHRDIKPGNILVDRTGVVKVLDMGLARFFNDEDDLLTRKYDENVLGTADYLAPEQADDSHTVDVRADIYSLGGTFYFLLTGKTPFGEGTVPQKLMWHRTRQPKPVSSFRGDVPAEVQAVLDKMMAKEPEQRYQSPGEISEALAPWATGPLQPPTENEMPRLSPAVTGAGTPGSLTGAPISNGPGSSVSKKTWQVTGAPGTGKSSSSSVIAGQTKATAQGPNAGPVPRAAVPPIPPSPAPTTRPGAVVNAPRPNVPPTPPRFGGPKKPEGNRSWVPLGADTADPVGRGDTPPLVPGKVRPVRRRSSFLSRIRKQPRLMLLFAGGTLMMVGLAAIGWIWLGRP
jgi:eukaryotic-like serine/threonine-protein kinase